MSTIWEADDTLWHEFIHPIIQKLDPAAPTGRRRTDERAAFNGVIYHMRTGCQWEAVPERFDKRSSVHRAFQRWTEEGVLEAIWAVLIDHCDELSSVVGAAVALAYNLRFTTRLT